MTYNDMYNDYHCCNIPYDYPYSFEERNKIYLQCKQIPYWIWNEFDTISISFDIKKLLKNCCCYPEITFEDIDPETNRFYITFYNFRYEELFQVEELITEKVSVNITKELSEKYFPSGIYFCSLILKSIDTTDEDQSGDNSSSDENVEGSDTGNTSDTSDSGNNSDATDISDVSDTIDNSGDGTTNSDDVGDAPLDTDDTSDSENEVIPVQEEDEKPYVETIRTILNKENCLLYVR